MSAESNLMPTLANDSLLKNEAFSAEAKIEIEQAPVATTVRINNLPVIADKISLSGKKRPSKLSL
jgi:hypothetical protein